MTYGSSPQASRGNAHGTDQSTFGSTPWGNGSLRHHQPFNFGCDARSNFDPSFLPHITCNTPAAVMACSTCGLPTQFIRSQYPTSSGGFFRHRPSLLVDLGPSLLVDLAIRIVVILNSPKQMMTVVHPGPTCASKGAKRNTAKNNMPPQSRGFILHASLIHSDELPAPDV